MEDEPTFSTLDRWMEDAKFREEFDKEYKEFILSELILAIMAENSKSVRQLAKEAGLSPTSIQKVRSGESKDMGLHNFIQVVEACGYSLVLEKGEKRISLEGLKGV